MAGEFTGSYVSPPVDCRMAVSSRVGINLSAGYTYMKTGYTYMKTGYKYVKSGKDLNMTGINIRLGIDF